MRVAEETGQRCQKAHNPSRSITRNKGYRYPRRQMVIRAMPLPELPRGSEECGRRVMRIPFLDVFLVVEDD